MMLVMQGIRLVIRTQSSRVFAVAIVVALAIYWRSHRCATPPTPAPIMTIVGPSQSMAAPSPRFDARIRAGETVIIHDPIPPTAVQFDFDGRCQGALEVSRGANESTVVVRGSTNATHSLDTGSWRYRLVCNDGTTVASGLVVVRRDAASRELPCATPRTASIVADGRTWSISYQAEIPKLIIETGYRQELHLESDEGKLVFGPQLSGPQTQIFIPGHALHDGVFRYWLESADGTRSKQSTLKIAFDQTAAGVYFEPTTWTQSLDVQAFDVDLRGEVVPGWELAIRGVTVPLESSRFAMKVTRAANEVVVVRASHPQRGVHLYVRRP